MVGASPQATEPIEDLLPLVQVQVMDPDVPGLSLLFQAAFLLRPGSRLTYGFTARVAIKVSR